MLTMLFNAFEADKPDDEETFALDVERTRIYPDGRVDLHWRPGEDAEHDENRGRSKLEAALRVAVSTMILATENSPPKDDLVISRCDVRRLGRSGGGLTQRKIFAAFSEIRVVKALHESVEEQAYKKNGYEPSIRAKDCGRTPGGFATWSQVLKGPFQTDDTVDETFVKGDRLLIVVRFPHVDNEWEKLMDDMCSKQPTKDQMIFVMNHPRDRDPKFNRSLIAARIQQEMHASNVRSFFSWPANADVALWKTESASSFENAYWSLRYKFFIDTAVSNEDQDELFLDKKTEGPEQFRSYFTYRNAILS